MIDLEELERLAKAATPGPWEMVDARAFLDDEDFEIRNGGHCIGYGTSGKDAAYIVAACNAVPELIARVRELEAELEQYKKPIDFPNLRKSVKHIDNSLSEFIDEAVKRAAHKP